MTTVVADFAVSEPRSADTDDDGSWFQAKAASPAANLRPRSSFRGRSTPVTLYYIYYIRIQYMLYTQYIYIYIYVGWHGSSHTAWVFSSFLYTVYIILWSRERETLSYTAQLYYILLPWQNATAYKSTTLSQTWLLLFYDILVGLRRSWERERNLLYISDYCMWHLWLSLGQTHLHTTRCEFLLLFWRNFCCFSPARFRCPIFLTVTRFEVLHLTSASRLLLRSSLIFHVVSFDFDIENNQPFAYSIYTRFSLFVDFGVFVFHHVV